jgi:hypothetical protein
MEQINRLDLLPREIKNVIYDMVYKMNFDECIKQINQIKYEIQNEKHLYLLPSSIRSFNNKKITFYFRKKVGFLNDTLYDTSASYLELARHGLYYEKHIYSSRGKCWKKADIKEPKYINKQKKRYSKICKEYIKDQKLKKKQN